MAIKYKVCPKCNSKNVAAILYGLPGVEILEEVNQGKIKLGGCMVGLDDPEYACNECNHEWSRADMIDHVYNKIKRIKAYVGGFSGPSYSVTLDLIERHIHWRQEGYEQEEHNKRITIKQIEELRENLKMINLLNWKRKYENPHILDGTQWSIEIEREGRTLYKHGSNDYPEEWEMFCAVIQEVCGRVFE